MEIVKEEMLTGDSAKTELAEDEFGLDKITASLSVVLSSRILASSYAIGIEGEWGAGKSSLVNFVTSILSKEKLTHKIIKFEPWLVGTKDALLATFFELLIDAVKEFGADPVVRNKLASNPSALDNVIARLSQYASKLQSGADAVDYAAAFDPTGKSKFAAAGLKVLAFIAKRVAPQKKSLEELKEQVKGDLQVLCNLAGKLRFTVIIDDLDRLDPLESVEVLRLIKAVADFPIITYLVCFDRDVLAKHVQTVLGVDDGYSYIEKIFQAFIPLPPQEPFALRRFARKLLLAAFPDEMKLELLGGRERVEREQVLFDVWIGRLIKTPRDAVRLCEAIKLGWPHIRTKADFIDYAWLQLIKLQSHALHSWVRDYVVNIGSYRDAGRPGDQEPAIEANRLVEILSREGWGSDRDRAGLQDFLPGVKGYTISANPRVFDIQKGELERFESGRRLGSPSHWRYYFSFDAPSYALEDDVLARFLQATITSPDEAESILRQLLKRPHANQSGYYLEVFLERLFDKRGDLTPDQIIGMGGALSQIMDEVPRPAGVHFGGGNSWERAKSLMAPPLSSHLPGLVKTAPSINWLGDVVRDQGFSLGKIDGTAARPDHVWLNEVDFDASRNALMTRLDVMGIEGIVQKPEPLILLYAWKQLGNAMALNAKIIGFTQSTVGFLDFLSALKTWVSSSSKGQYEHIRSDVLDHFFLSFDDVRSRLQSLGRDAPTELRARARKIFDMLEDERN